MKELGEAAKRSGFARLARVLGEGVPLGTLASLTAQFWLGRREILRFRIGGRSFYFRRDIATLAYGHSAVSRILRVVEAVGQAPIGRLVDVGANNGWFAAAIADAHPGVHAILVEPNADLAGAIAANLGPRRIEYSLHTLGVSDAEGTRMLSVTRSNSQLSSLVGEAVKASTAAPIEQVPIDTTTLDSITSQEELECIDLLKVDIQGAERILLKGARRTLERTKMAIFEICFLDEHAPDVFVELRDEFGGARVLAPVAYGADVLFYRR